VNESEQSLPATLAEALADFVLAADVPPALLVAARLRMIDAFGIALAGAATPPAQAARETARLAYGAGPCRTAVGEERLSPSGAAFVNAVLMHVLDFDDTYLSGAIHTHPVVLPAALAAADVAGASVAGVLRATAVATEALCWLADRVSPQLHLRGFHPTALLGALSSTLAAGMVLGLDRRQLLDAIGLVGGVTGGTWQFEESWLKNWNLAHASQTGLTAALAGRSGFIGPARSFDGQYGVFATHLDKPVALDLASLGVDWVSARSEMKRYGCCHYLQSVVDCALQAAEVLSADDIASVHVAVPGELAIRCIAVPEEARRRPESDYRARFAGQWLVAKVLIDRTVTLATFDNVVPIPGNVCDLADRVTFGIAHFDSFPATWPARLTVTTKGGKTLTFASDDQGNGFAERSRARVFAKANENVQYCGVAGDFAGRLDAALSDGTAPFDAVWRIVRDFAPRPNETGAGRPD